MVHRNAIGLGRGPGKIDQRPDPVQFACLFMPHFAAGALAGRGGDREVVVYCRDRVFSCTAALFDRGLEIGETVSRARALFPRALFLPRQRGLEEHRWDELLQQLHDCTPQVLPLHDDQLIGRWVLLQGFDPDQLQSRVRECQARAATGVTPVEVMVAATGAASGQLLQVDCRHDLYSRTPVEQLKFLGFDRDLPGFLLLLGFRYLADLEVLTKRQLVAQFRSAGQRLYRLLHPPPVRALARRDDEAVDRTEGLEWSPGDRQQLEEICARLLRSALDEDPRSVRNLKLVLQFRNGSRSASQLLKRPSRRFELLMAVFCALIVRSLDRRESEVTAVTVRLGGLVPSDAEQADLFQPQQGRCFLHALARRFPGKLHRPALVPAFLPERAHAREPLRDGEKNDRHGVRSPSR